MNRILFCALFFGLAAGCEAQSVGRLAEISLVDRETGAVLNSHYYRGEYWVAGRPGARYSIQIHNRLSERLMAVTSVDGVNVISGATAGWDQTGYVFGAGERYQITGWRKTDAEVAAFTFTESPNSYAERTGRPANVGVIGVAVFRELQPQPADSPPVIGQSSVPQEIRREAAADAFVRGQSAESMSSGAQRTLPAAPPLRADASVSVPAAALKLGTGHGEREYSYVNHTEFARMQSQPDEVIRIHYDSLDNLFAMGILKRPRSMPSTVNPFPASPSQQYVPDPMG